MTRNVPVEADVIQKWTEDVAGATFERGVDLLRLTMKTSRLRWYILASIILHLFLLWLLRFLPSNAPIPPAPVAIRMLDTPLVQPEQPKSVSKPPELPQPEPQKALPKPNRSKQGGVLAELPKPVREERPEEARIVSQYDSRAQDVGPGEAGAQRPSGEKPPQMPPELALPERYSRSYPAPPQEAPAPSVPSPPTPARPTPQLQARRFSQPEAQPEKSRPPDIPQKSDTGRQKVLAPPAETPELRRFRITDQQELAMLQREHNTTEEAPKQTMEEHFTRLEKHQPLPSFDAPGVYNHGPERPGEGQQEEGGGKYRSIDSFGLKHFSYLVGVKNQIELVFSVPFFVPNHGSIGVPIVGFTIRRSGELAEAVLLRSSGYAVLDKALLDAVRRAAPYGPFPRHLTDPELSIRVYATVS